jgi:hypothetical protein
MDHNRASVGVWFLTIAGSQCLQVVHSVMACTTRTVMNHTCEAATVAMEVLYLPASNNFLVKE